MLFPKEGSKIGFLFGRTSPQMLKFRLQERQVELLETEIFETEIRISSVENTESPLTLIQR